MPLADFLESMERLGVADPEYVKGYADSFSGTTLPGRWTEPYRRGAYAGEAARKRGAHRER
jgi:hypothetical protein